MRTPNVKWYNTIALKFLEGDRNIIDCESLLSNVFGVTSRDVIGIGYINRFTYHVEFKSSDLYSNIASNHNASYDVNDSKIKVIDVSSYSTKVTIRNVPFRLSNMALHRVLGDYGTVEDVQLCRNTEGSMFLDAVSTERIAWMRNIRTPIPSSIFLNLTQSHIYFHYYGQPRTCTRCGDAYHKSENCEISEDSKPQNRNNAVKIQMESLYEFPVLSSESPSPTPTTITPGNDNQPDGAMNNQTVIDGLNALVIASRERSSPATCEDIDVSN